MRQPLSAGRQMAIFGSSKRRATWRASASIAPAVSVVNSTSRVRSNNRVTSLRLAKASELRGCREIARDHGDDEEREERDPVLGIGNRERTERRQKEEVERQHGGDRDDD